VILVLMMLLLGLVAPTAAQTSTHKVYLPMVRRNPPASIFGIESAPAAFSQRAVYSRAAELQSSWVRLNGVLWHELQPQQGGPYNWNALSTLDRAIDGAMAGGITPAVVIRGAPSWASVTPSSCSAVREDRLNDYAAFLEALARRYAGRVTYWELGNEPDVDPSLIPGDFPFGCVGDIRDPYYGGERYGRTLRVAAAALRRGNPQVRIIFGGLLLDRPSSSDPALGRPELFFEGALRAGAGDSFDIVAFHAYPSYNGQRFVDQDLQPNSPWLSRGGFVRGKAAFLREVMARYNVNKPLWLNEGGLICNPSQPFCAAPATEFFAAKADHLPRKMARAASAGIQMVGWYTLEGPGWRNGGLLNEAQQPRPAFVAYQQMSRLVRGYTQVLSVDYGPGVEAYRFVLPGKYVDLLWSRSATVQTVSIPLVKILAQTGVTGGGVPGQIVGNNAQLQVGFSPIYIERLP
jgi:hypothetical protein